MNRQSLSDQYELITAKENIRMLKEDLCEARKNLLKLLPFNLTSILSSYNHCLDRVEANGWEESAAKKVIDNATIIGHSESSFYGDTAFCPLCGSGSSSFYERGFTHPEGLRRHLVGFGNAHQCILMKTAYNLASDYWNKKFAEEDEKVREQNTTEEAERRRTETLYVLSHNGEPKLIDKGMPFSLPRDETQLLWAETRLLDLQFIIVIEGNVKSYVKECGDYIIYADPLTLGCIRFYLYKKLPTKSGRRSSRNWAVEHYSIQDKWKNNLSAKLDLFVSNATKKLTKIR